MKTLKKLFTCVCCIIAICVNAQDYTAFSETFGTPATTIEQTTYDVPLVPTSPTTISNVCNFIPVPGTTSSYAVPSTNTTWFSNGTNNYYGLVTSADLFGGTTLGHGGTGGFLAFTWTNKGTSTGFDTFWRTIIPGDRFVKNSNYELSGFVAGDAGISWNPAAESPRGVVDFKLLPAIYFAVSNLTGTNFTTITSISGVTPTSVKDTTVVTNAAGWTPFSIRTDRYLATPPGVKGDVVFDLRCSHSKSTVILIDDVQITGPRPTISAQQNSTNCTSITLSASSSSPAVSAALNVSSNHAGITPITASITGADAQYFTLCDQTGNPYTGSYAITGDNIYVKYSPDVSVIDAQAATLTLTASSNPAYGVAPVTISLTGNIDLGTDVKTSVFRKELILKNSLVTDFLSVSAPFADKVEWIIFNQAGKQVATYTGSAKLNANVSNLVTGTYIIKATKTISGETAIGRFIKK